MADGAAVALLAAGMARRFGGGKLDQDLGGKPVGCWSAHAAQAAGFARYLVITPPAPPSFVDRLTGWERIINDDHATGMASSIRAAATAAQGHSRLVIMLADMPLIDVDHIRRITRSNRVAFTLYPDGRRGVPAGFPPDAVTALASLPDACSPAKLDWSNVCAAFEPLSANSLVDVDSKADLAAARCMTGTLNWRTSAE